MSFEGQGRNKDIHLKLNISKIALDNGRCQLNNYIEKHTLRVEWSRDRWRHVTSKDQGRDSHFKILWPIQILKAHDPMSPRFPIASFPPSRMFSL